MNKRKNNSRHSEELSAILSNAVNNQDSLILKINPRYKVLTRPYTSSEYKWLRDSIKEIGQEQPIIIDEDCYVLDGHQRLKACEELAIEPWIEVRKYQLFDGKSIA